MDPMCGIVGDWPVPGRELASQRAAIRAATMTTTQ